MFNLLPLLLGAIGLFLSIWIIVPAPYFFCLPLSVGAPELSPWLVGLNATAAALALLGKRSWVSLALLGCSVTGLVLSSLPLSQLSVAAQQAETAMEQALGPTYWAEIPLSAQIQMRSQPYVLADSLRGISVPPVRHLTGIPFANPDGVALTLEVYQPLQPGSYPAIVVIYGGAWQRGKPTDNADCNRYLAAQGYVVWAIDYRHAPRYRFPNQLKDVQTALRFIQLHGSEYETDPNQLVIMGRSAGAHLAMLSAYQAEEFNIRAVVNFYGPVDLTAGYTNPPNPDPINSRQVLQAFLGGTPSQLPQRYRLASPITFATKPLPPTLLVYGGRDHIVQAKYGRQLLERLQSVGSQAVLVEIPWADHAFDTIFNGLSNQLALYHTERFLAWILRSPT